MTTEIKTLREPDMKGNLVPGEAFVLFDGVGMYAPCVWDGKDASPLAEASSDYEHALSVAELRR